MMPRLIGLTGRAGCGKDTLADHILNTHTDYFKYKFADPIKKMVNELLGSAMYMWEDREWKEKEIPWIGASPRRLAQTIGTEWGRNTIGTDIWLRAAAKAYTEVGRPAGGMIISDVRFANEAEWIKERGGVVVEIQRPANTTLDRTSAQHPSESGLSRHLVDGIIINNESVGVLCSRGYMKINSLGI